MKKYIVELDAVELDELLRLSRSGKTSGCKLTRARILLKADEGLEDEEIAEAVGTSVATIERTRQRFVAEGLGALSERPRPGPRPKLAAKGQQFPVRREEAEERPRGREEQSPERETGLIFVGGGRG